MGHAENKGSIFSMGFSQSKLLDSDLLKIENEFSDSPFLKMKGDIDQLLITESARSKGMDVEFYSSDIYRISCGNRSVLFSRTSAMISEVYRHCAQMKHLTKELLSRNKVPVPPGAVFGSYREAFQYFKEMNEPVVVKPVSGSHGRGITTGITDEDAFEKAWNTAKSKSTDIIVEKHIIGCDIRVNVIGGRAIAACIRIPANVVGDGHSSIQELVDDKNKRRRRNPAHLMMSEYIKRFDLLESSGLSLNEVPKFGERVWLSGVANVSVGGEGVQLVEHLDSKILRVAERAAAAFPGVYHVGVDVIVPDYDTSEACEPTIIEINTNAATSAPVFPSYGNVVDLPGLLLDYLFDASTEILATPDGGRADTCAVKQLAIADEWDYERYDPKSRRMLAGQRALISLAANKLNLNCSHIGKTVAAVDFAGKHTLFHRSMPDVVPQVARRACSNSDILGSLLEKKGVISSLGMHLEAESLAEEEPRRYRLLVINGRVVAGLERARETGVALQSDKSKPSNNSRGNQDRDISEEIHEQFASIAVKAVEAVFSPFIAGVDIVARAISESPNTQAWLVSDVVCNPALGWHHFPSYGKGRDVALALLSALFAQASHVKTPLQHLKITVVGDVRGLQYRKWIQKACHQAGILGKVQQVSEQAVQISAQGTPVAVSTLLSQCALGPKKTSAFDVQVDALPIARYEQFEVV